MGFLSVLMPFCFCNCLIRCTLCTVSYGCSTSVPNSTLTVWIYIKKKTWLWSSNNWQVVPIEGIFFSFHKCLIIVYISILSIYIFYFATQPHIFSVSQCTWIIYAEIQILLKVIKPSDHLAILNFQPSEVLWHQPYDQKIPMFYHLNSVWIVLGRAFYLSQVSE